MDSLLGPPPPPHALGRAVPAPSYDPTHIVFRDAAREGAAVRRALRGAPPAPPCQPNDADPLDADLARFYGHILNTGGLDLRRYRSSVLRRREAACLRALRRHDLAIANRLVESDPAQAERALRVVMIGVTSFFRDPHVFEALRDRLRQLGRGDGERLRILSVGCSDGSELYSVAILLDELGRADAELVGVDCRADAIATAREGWYPTEAVAHLSGDRRERAFLDAHSSRGPGVRVAEHLRARCRWSRGDAFALDAAPAYDVILCRNLAIYLTHEAADELWTRLGGLLRPGGLLVVGKAERPSITGSYRRLGSGMFERTRSAG